MKKYLLFTLLSILSLAALAQETENPSLEKKNIIKLNLPALAFKNIVVQYERALGKKMSITGLFRLMPESSVPFKSTLKEIIDDPDTERQLDHTKIGNVAFTPELRFYLGKKGVFNGFYIAPFASIARYNTELSYHYEDGLVTKSIPLSGGLTSITGGILFGAQWDLAQQFYLDWWIIGPHYGSSDGELTGRKSLTASEQSALRAELDELDIPLTKTTYTVDANGATVFFKGPWGGVRSGICIGFRF